jgi:hypothetical protein
LPGLLAGVAAAVRTFVLDRHVLEAVPTLDWGTFKSLVSSGGGQWLASLGWQLAFASDAVIIGYLGSRELVPVFVITSRLGLTLMQLSWTMPDRPSVGLAQMKPKTGWQERWRVILAPRCRTRRLRRSHRKRRVRDCLGGRFALWRPCAQPLFALAVIVLSVVHALVTPIGVLGRRMTVGLLTALNGMLHIVLALGLGRIWGLPGVALATSVSALLSTLPAGLKLLTAMTSITPSELRRSVFSSWLARAIPCLVVAYLAGLLVIRFEESIGASRITTLIVAVADGGASALLYLLAMRPLTRVLPLGPRLRQALLSLRLV